MYWVVYLIQNTSSLEKYIGVTGNLNRRLIQHNSKENKSTVRTKGSWILIYAEAYRSRKDAYMRERMLKHHGSSKRKLYDRISNSILRVE